MRRLRISHFLVDPRHCFKVSDSTFEAAGSTPIDDVVGTSNSLIWKGLKYLLSITVSRCWRIIDVGVSALGHGCGQILEINKYLSKPVIEVDTNVYDDAIIIGIL
jgi:hypothetical protein